MDVLAGWFGAAGLTVVIETGIMVAAGYRSRRFVLACVCINIATNLTLNVLLALFSMKYRTWSWGLVGVLEAVVVVVEWSVLRLAAGSEGQSVPFRSRATVRLAGFVVLANLASFAAGLLFRLSTTPW